MLTFKNTNEVSRYLSPHLRPIREELVELSRTFTIGGAKALVNKIGIPEGRLFAPEIECTPNYRQKVEADRLLGNMGWEYCIDGGGREYTPISPLQGRDGLKQVKEACKILKRLQFRCPSPPNGGHTNVERPELSNENNRRTDAALIKLLFPSFKLFPGARNYGSIPRPFWKNREVGGWRTFFVTAAPAYLYKGTVIAVRGDYEDRYEFRFWAGTLDYDQWLAQFALGFWFADQVVKVDNLLSQG